MEKPNIIGGIGVGDELSPPPKNIPPSPEYQQALDISNVKLGGTVKISGFLA